MHFLFLACLICCCNLRHCGCRPRNSSSRLSFSLVRHDPCCLVRDLLRHSDVTRSIWHERKMETHWRAKYEFFVAKQNASKTFSALKLAASDSFIPTLFDENKQIFASYTLQVTVRELGIHKRIFIKENLRATIE